MFPLNDSSPREKFPVVNYAIVSFNIFIFFLQISSGSFDRFILQNAFVPLRFNLANFDSYAFIVTSMFIHGSIWHIAANLWFLHIFGDNVEDRMGHLPYAVFYLIAGIIATLAQYIVNPVSPIPLIGASGAISGVAGAYVVLFHKSKIKSLVITGFYITTTYLPVWLFLGYWFAIQLISGFTTYNPSDLGGTAWFAHIGGFLFGVFIALFYKIKQSSRAIIS